MSHSQSGGTLKIAGALIFFGGGALLHGLRRLRQVRRLTDAASSRIASAPQGTVEVQGYAWPVKPLENPFELSNVVFYDFKIEEERKSGNSSSWHVVFSDTSTQPFAIIDTTGFAIIYPQSADFELRTKVYPDKELAPGPKNAIQSHLLRKGSRFELGQRTFISHRLRYTFRALFKGSPMNVLGNFSTLATLRAPPLESGFAEFLQRCYSFRKNFVFDLKRFDKNHDGKISVDEWYDAHLLTAQMKTETYQIQTAGSNSLSTIATTTTQDPFLNSSGIFSSSKEQPMSLADCHKGELIERLDKWNWPRILGGALMVAAGLTMLAFLHLLSPL